MRVPACRIAALTLFVLAAAPLAAQENKTRLKLEDLYLFDSPRSSVLAPDGKSAAFIRTWIDKKTKQERHSLWLSAGSADQARPLETGEPDARLAVFSPDGKWIAFLSTRPRPAGWQQIPPVPPYSDAATDIWLIPAGGGQAIPLAGANKPYGRVFNDGFYGRMAFSKDGKRLVFVADDGVDPRTQEEIERNVIVVRDDQGEGYTGYGPAQIWVAHLGDMLGACAAQRIDRLTKDDIWYGDPHWSPDGATIFVHANKTEDRESVRYSINKNFDIWAIDVATGKQQQLTSGPGPEVSPRVSPDGKTIVCLSVPRKGSHRDVFNLVTITLGSGGPHTRVLFDHHGPDADKAPHLAPSFPLPDDCWLDANHLVYNSEQGTRTATALLDLTTGKSSGAVGSPKDNLQRRALAAKLTPPGNLFLKQRLLAPSKVVTWKNDVGQTIEGILTLPPDGIAKTPHKVVVHPHGGPHSRSALGFDFTVQVLAASGYAVFQPNFRGTHGYGQKFIDADRFDFGGGDMRDILSGIDQLVRDGIVDPKRQFVYGTSYGGYMTTWLVGQTNQFRAAVAQNAVTDLTMMWGLTDIQSWTQWEFGGYPWEVPGPLRERSPLTHVAKVKTPTLILHAHDDRRVPLPLGIAYHKALKARSVPTQMVIYPDEGHGIRQPLHREDVLRRVLEWFGRFEK